MAEGTHCSGRSSNSWWGSGRAPVTPQSNPSRPRLLRWRLWPGAYRVDEMAFGAFPRDASVRILFPSAIPRFVVDPILPQFVRERTQLSTTFILPLSSGLTKQNLARLLRQDWTDEIVAQISDSTGRVWLVSQVASYSFHCITTGCPEVSRRRPVVRDTETGRSRRDHPHFGRGFCRYTRASCRV